MSRPSRLHSEAISTLLADKAHRNWTLVDGKLHREIKFDDFVSAWGFMNQVALMAEKLDHHPDWFNAYNRVVIDLSTHDAGGITALDFELAAKIETVASRY